MAESRGAADSRLKVFVSYSRQDLSFTERLVEALEARGLDVLIDRRDLPLAVEFQKELLGFIRQADTVVYVVSEASITSRWCEWEVQQVDELHKRLAPVVVQAVEDARIPDSIRKINFVFFTGEHAQGRGFEAQADALAAALKTDVGWLKEHTRLGELARRWIERGKVEDALLRGLELEEAAGWDVRRPREAPPATEQQFEFLAASRAAQAARLKREQDQVVRTRRFQKRATWALTGAVVLALALLGGALWQSRETSIRESRVFSSLAQRSIDQGLYDRSMRYALQGLPTARALPWTYWSQQLESKLAAAAFASALRVELKGHTDVLSSAVFSPDGTMVLTASYDKTAKVWSTTSGEVVTVLTGHEGVVLVAAFSPDGSRVVTASNDRTARVWEVPSGKPLTVMKAHTGSVTSAEFSPDGRRVVSNGAVPDQTTLIWDAATGEVHAALKAHDGSMNSVVFSRDGTRVVTTSLDKTARVWDTSTGREIALLRHDDSVKHAAFSPDGRWVVTASIDKTARIWNAATGAVRHVLRGHDGPLWHAAFSRDGSRVVTVSYDWTARVWDATSGVEHSVLKGHEGPVSLAAFSPDGTRVVTASWDNTARLWDADSGKQIDAFKGHKKLLPSAAFSVDGTKVVTASYDKTARIWDAVATPVVTVFKGHGDALVGAAFSPDGSRVLSASDDGTAQVWNAASGTVLAVLGNRLPDEHRLLALAGRREGAIRLSSAHFNKDGSRVVTTSDDRTARIWDASTGALLTVLKGHQGRMTGAAFSPDGSRVATASDDMTARVWDAASGATIAILRGHEKGLSHIAYSPDGSRLLTASYDWTARLWDAATGTEQAVLKGHAWHVYTATFSPDGRRAVTSSYDKTARVWDTATGSALVVLKGHEEHVSSAAFSPDGSRIVTASGDKTARVWDAASGVELATMRGHSGDVKSAAFSPDGTRVVTASNDWTARIWDAFSGDPIAIFGWDTYLVGPIAGRGGHVGTLRSAAFGPDGSHIVTASDSPNDRTAIVWDVRWASLVRGGELRGRACAEKLIGAQEFTAEELGDPILRGIDPSDPTARNPCLRSGPLSLEYWSQTRRELLDAVWRLVARALP